MFGVSHQRQAERRDRTKASGAEETQGFTVDTVGVFRHYTLGSDLGEWTLGFDVYRDVVSSFLDKGAAQQPKDDVQGPVADDASYLTAGLFAEDRIALTDRLDLTVGARLNHAAVDAEQVLDPVTETATTLEQDWQSFVGSARFGYDLDGEGMRLYGGVSQGFRAPNLSDLTRLDSARSNEFEVPAPDLEPEFTTSWELGVKQRTDTRTAQVALFYTRIEDGIVRVPTGATNAEGEVLVSKANVGDGFVWGLEAGASQRLGAELELFGSATWMEGYQDTFPTSDPVAVRETITRLMPFTVMAGGRWTAPSKGSGPSCCSATRTGRPPQHRRRAGRLAHPGRHPRLPRRRPARGHHPERGRSAPHRDRQPRERGLPHPWVWPESAWAQPLRDPAAGFLRSPGLLRALPCEVPGPASSRHGKVHARHGPCLRRAALEPSAAMAGSRRTGASPWVRNLRRLGRLWALIGRIRALRARPDLSGPSVRPIPRGAETPSPC